MRLTVSSGVMPVLSRRVRAGPTLTSAKAIWQGASGNFVVLSEADGAGGGLADDAGDAGGAQGLGEHLAGGGGAAVDQDHGGAAAEACFALGDVGSHRRAPSRTVTSARVPLKPNQLAA